MALSMRWTKRFFKRLGGAQSPKHPARNRNQPKIQRLRNSLVKLVHYAHDAATRWCATHIKCALAVHARDPRSATSADAF
jgi:hypothetical protein